ncbi:MAG: OmpA family protein [Gemmatimonadota bacterium]|nr:OmpA family protein [Gemmatimonadota bacterium]
MRLRASFAVFSLLLVAAPIAAQDAGTIELGLFPQVGSVDASSGLEESSWGFGGLIGYFLAENLSLEAAGGVSFTEDVGPRSAAGKWIPIRGRALYSFPIRDRVRPFVGLGAVRNVYTGVVDDGDWGVSGLTGLRLYVTDNVAFRTDVTVDRVWAPFNEGAIYEEAAIENHTNWMITGGLSVGLGATPRDSDGDGVPDRDDDCLTTPMGVSVDAVGCRVDSDGDGVFDEADRCANTPSGVDVDAMGCRVDADGDGVFDEDDRCEATPSGARVDASGCRVDTDGDGVFDENDRCAATPSNVRVDDRGCRVDADGDGVFDEDDRCANSPRGSDVDERGCPVLFEEDETSLVLEGVTFETSSADLTSEALTILNRVAEALNGNPEVRVRVSGHTDSTGSRAFNVRLSQSRAESVVAYLVSRGVAANRMEAQGFGPDQPMADNGTEEGRRQNRRVELARIN